MQEFINTLTGDLSRFVLHCVYAAILLFACFKLAKWLPKKMEQMKVTRKIEKTVFRFAENWISIVIRIGALVGACVIIGVPGSAFITVFGSAGVAIGLALQGSLSNLAGGLMLMFFRPFSVGDFISTGDDEGTVTEISTFYTTIRTMDYRRVVLPNSTLTNKKLINCSVEKRRLIDLKFTAGYEAETEHVRDVLLKLCAEDEKLLKTPEPQVPVTSLSDRGVVYNLRVWVNPADYLEERWKLIEEVKLSFEREGIRIPFPQTDIVIRNEETEVYKSAEA